MTQEFEHICNMIQQLNDDLLQLYTPTVKDICNRVEITESELEHFLDYLVSACISNDMLLLLKKVCRRFYQEYPEIIAEYIMIYKEMYEFRIILRTDMNEILLSILHKHSTMYTMRNRSKKEIFRI